MLPRWKHRNFSRAIQVFSVFLFQYWAQFRLNIPKASIINAKRTVKTLLFFFWVYIFAPKKLEPHRRFRIHNRDLKQGLLYYEKRFRSTARHPGLSSHRYSVNLSADSEIFAFSAMFRAEPADFNFDISGHNWFSDEHFWTSLIQRWTLLASSKQAKTMKKAKKSVSFSILMLKRREIENFWITFNGLFWKFLKMWFFRDLYFLLIPCQKTSY